MHQLTHCERTECRQLARDIVTVLTNNTWNVFAWQGKKMSCARLANTCITLAAVKGQYSDLSLVRGNSLITISVPNQCYRKTQVLPNFSNNLERVIFGILIHECTHVLQKKAAPTAFRVAKRNELFLSKIKNPTQQNKFDFYIGQPFEQEARAAQAAAEVELLVGLGVSQTCFEQILPSTEVYKRTEVSVGKLQNTIPSIAVWWEMWSAMAYDAYVYWRLFAPMA